MMMEITIATIGRLVKNKCPRILFFSVLDGLLDLIGLNERPMNRREAIIAGVAGVAAAVAVPPVAKAEASPAEHPEVEPIRALLRAHDKAFTNQDLNGVMTRFAAKAAIMGTGPGEIWSGPDERVACVSS